MLKLNIRAFFFNAQTDYLPYYKNFSFKVDANKKIIDLLNMIKEKNSNFSFPTKNTILKINEHIVGEDETLATITEKLGTQLQIDPALAYRSNNGLILDDSDFMESFELLSEFSDNEDRAYYQSLYPLHYASGSFIYNHEYIGDAILLLASRLITKNPEKEDEILEAINDEFNGIVHCEYENNILNGQDYTQVIENLKKKILKSVNPSFIEKICDLVVKKRVYTLSNDSISKRKFALYTTDPKASEIQDQTEKIIQRKNAKFINFPMSTRLAGQSIIQTNPQLAYKKAGTMLLDALDHGADTLLFTNDEDLTLFDSIIHKCEKAVGRPIELQLISLKKFNNEPQKEIA